MAKISKKKCSHPRWARYAKTCNLCEAEVGTAERPLSLAPGLYTLNKPVDNTHGKDGRSKDWNKKEEIEVGLYFVYPNQVESWNSDTHESKWIEYGCRIEAARNNGYNRVEPNHPAYDDMVANMTPCEGTDEEWLDYQGRSWGNGYAGSPEAILLKLMKKGQISRDQILEVIADNRKDE